MHIERLAIAAYSSDRCHECKKFPHTEELFAPTTFFDNLDQTRFQLFDRRDVIRKNTHVSGFCGDVDLDTDIYPISTEYNPDLIPFSVVKRSLDVHIGRFVD